MWSFNISTANNEGQRNLTTCQSRGYFRTSLAVGGGFENVASVCGPTSRHIVALAVQSEWANSAKPPTFWGPSPPRNHYNPLREGFIHIITIMSSSNRVFLEVIWNGAIVITINARRLWTSYRFTVTAMFGRGQYTDCAQ